MLSNSNLNFLSIYGSKTLRSAWTCWCISSYDDPSAIRRHTDLKISLHSTEIRFRDLHDQDASLQKLLCVLILLQLNNEH